MILRINPIIVNDLQAVKEFISEDNPDMAEEVVDFLYDQFSDILNFPYAGANLSNRVSFKTDLKYRVYGNYLILYKVKDGFVEIHRVLHCALDLLRLIDEEM